MEVLESITQPTTDRLFIAANSFFNSTRRNTLGLDKRTNEDLFKEIETYFHMAKPGYRDGVLLVPISPTHLKSRVVKMTEVTRFITTYEARVEGETPRKKTQAVVRTLPSATAASAVIYRHDVLREKNEQSTEAEWELITVLAHACEGGEPMTVGTLLANHFGADGGTDTKMTPEIFESTLRESYVFWKDHAMAVEEKEL